VSIAQSAMTSQELVCFDWRAVSAVSQRLRNVPNGLCGDIPNIRHTLSWLWQNRMRLCILRCLKLFT